MSFKVIVFSWQLLSRQNLFRQRVTTNINNTLCVLCDYEHACLSLELTLGGFNLTCCYLVDLKFPKGLNL
jgi:hypothetical protein